MKTIMNILTTLAQSTYYYYENGSSYSSNSLTAEEAAGVAGVFVFFAAIAFLFAIATYVISAICLMQIFKKAGVKPWIAWVPFYNSWKVLEIGGQQGFWAILAPIASVATIWVMRARGPKAGEAKP